MSLGKVRAAASTPDDFDIDGVAIQPLEGGHRFDLELGYSFRIYLLTVFDRRPERWVLFFTDSAVEFVDETETLADPCAFDCAPIELKLDAPVALDGLGERRLRRLTFEAHADPFSFALALHFEGGSLELDQAGPWRLRDAQGLRPAPAFSVKFAVRGVSP